MRRCCICDCELRTTHWVCGKCATSYGLMGPVSTWPKWAQVLRCDEKNERRVRQQDARLTVPWWEDESVDDRYPSERGIDYAYATLRDMGVECD